MPLYSQTDFPIKTQNLKMELMLINNKMTNVEVQ